MTEQFKGKKIFLLCSAPDPKINHEKVKDHTWVTVKGSGWAIDNIWNIDRIPDYTFMTGHHRHKFIIRKKTKSYFQHCYCQEYT